MANFKVTDARFKIDTLPDPIDHIQMEFQISNSVWHRDSTVFDFKTSPLKCFKHRVRGRFSGRCRSYLSGWRPSMPTGLAELERMYSLTEWS